MYPYIATETGALFSVLKLRDFDKLAKLDVPLALLIGHADFNPGQLADVLPKGLEHLCLNDDVAGAFHFEWPTSTITKNLEVWLSNWRSVTPHLQTVELELSNSRPDLMAMEKICQKAGVNYIIHTSHILPSLHGEDRCTYYRISNEEGGLGAANVADMKADQEARYQIERREAQRAREESAEIARAKWKAVWNAICEAHSSPRARDRAYREAGGPPIGKR